MEAYDEFSGLSRRRYVAPNFAEARAAACAARAAACLRLRAHAAADAAAPLQVRHVLNMAQVRGSAPNLRLITFDADGTLYEARPRAAVPVPR